jgi:hypothetical protein
VNRLLARVRLPLLLSLFACLTVAAIPSFGQQGTTAVVGDVTDPQGAAINGAKVVISDDTTGVTRTTQTDEQGQFQFLSLQPGTYVVRVESTGFKSSQTGRIAALVSTTQKLSIKMELGTVSDTVTVTEGAVAQINTTDATMGNAFESRQILALPFEGRDAAGVLSLQPGVTYIGNNPNINDKDVDTRNGALNGGRSDQANITLDGVDNNAQATGKAFQGAVRSTLDSIEEFRVTTAGDNADQGRSSGGQVTLITRSGTNSFHGSLYEQNRPTVTAANDWFNKHAELTNGEPNVPGKVIRNTFGGSISGPILKDRLFFFGTYEGQRLAENQQVNRNVPSANLRDGVVLYPCADVTQCPGGSVQGLSGQSYAFPAGTNGLSPAQIKSMDQNCIAAGTCPMGNGPNPNVVPVFNKYPAANSNVCGNADGFNISCFSFSAPNPQHLNTNIAKIDYNITRSGSHRLFVRGNYQTDRDALPPQFPGQPPADVIRDTSRAIAVGYTAVLSKSVINSFHYGLTRQSQDNLGLEKSPIVTFRFIDDLVPSVASNPTNEQSFTTKFHIPVHNFADDVTWTKGKHTLQFGTNLRFINNVTASDIANITFASTNPFWLAGSAAGSGGTLDPAAVANGCNPAQCPWSFPAVDPNNATPYNNAVVNLVGIVSQVTGQYNRDKNGTPVAPSTLVPRDFRSWEYDWYAQDVWRLKPTLTITAGLRYTILEPPYETHGNQITPDISLSNFVTQRANAAAQGQFFDQQIGYNTSGQANGKQPFWPYDYKNLGPRLSIAYAPNPSGGLLKSIFGGGGKSSIRAGFGIVYDHYGEGLLNTYNQNGALGLTTVVTNAASVQTLDGGARFTGLNNIPTQSANGVLLTPAPTGSFPYVPPVSTQGNTVQQIAFGFDDALKTPYSELVDLSFTRELPGGFVFEAAYVGRFAHRLLQQRDLAMPINLKDPKSGMDYFTAATLLSKLANANTPVSQVSNIPFFQNFFPGAAGVNGTTPGCTAAPGAGALANPTATQSMYELFFCNTGGATLGGSNAVNVFDTNCFPACATINGQAQPFEFYNPQFTALYAWSSIGKSNYNAGQFTLRSRPTHGLQFDFNYTYSASFDIGSDAERSRTYGGLSAIINTWDPNAMRGPSDFDARHQLNSNWIYDLPFGRGKKFGGEWGRPLNALAGGWQASGILRWTSGFPFSVADGSTFSTDFQLGSFSPLSGPKPSTGTTFVTSQSGAPFAFKGDPNVVGSGAFTSNFLRFSYPGETGPRNIFRGDGFFGLDFGINKSFQITERQTLRFSAQAYNLTNAVRFDPATVTQNSALSNPTTVGLYSGTLTKPRVMEFALRYQF